MKSICVFAIVGLMACWAFSQDEISGISGLSAWYRADNVTKNADNVLTALKDCSGKAHDIVPGPNAPTVVDGVVNGKPVLRFTVTKTTIIDTLNNWSAKGFTAFVVASYSDIPPKPAIRYNKIVTPGQALISDGGSAGLALGLNCNGRPGMTAGISLVDPINVLEPPYRNEQSSELIIVAKKFYAFAYASAEGKSKANPTDCRLSVSVSANELTSPSASSPFVSTQAMNGGKALQIGAAGSEAPFKGDIAEIIIFNTELSAKDRSKVFSYLRTRYDLRTAAECLPAEPVTVTPTFESRTFWFRDSVVVVMSAPSVGSEIRYTTNGASPEKKSPLYSKPARLTKSTTIMARAFAPGRDPSPEVIAKFVKIAPVKQTAKKLAGGWRFSWGDEFQGPTVDSSIWGYEIGYVRNSEAQYYSDRVENSQIDNGTLLIRGLHDNWDGHEYTSASRSTENKVRLTYGRYEMRGKIDIRSGSWPAWWLWSRPDGGGHPREGEVDIMEYYTGKCLFNIMDGAGKWNTNKRSITSLGGPRWATEFHVWTMVWDSDKMDIYLDGTLMVHYLVEDANGTGPNGTNPFRNPQTKKMVLNQALGGSWGGSLSAADAPFEFRVDWMRVHTWSNETAYTLTVNGGSGSGPYVVGTQASITANMPPDGYVFDKWMISGDTAIDKPGNASATITMPASDVTVTAAYLAK